MGQKIENKCNVLEPEIWRQKYNNISLQQGSSFVTTTQRDPRIIHRNHHEFRQAKKLMREEMHLVYAKANHRNIFLEFITTGTKCFMEKPIPSWC